MIIRIEDIIAQFVTVITITEGITATDIVWLMPTDDVTSTAQEAGSTMKMDARLATTTTIQTVATRWLRPIAEEIAKLDRRQTQMREAEIMRQQQIEIMELYARIQADSHR